MNGSGSRIGRIDQWRETEQQIDLSGMRGLISGFPDQLVEGIGRAAGFAPEWSGYEPPAAIAVLGMGGSAIAGDLVAAASEKDRRKPMITVRGYGIPDWLEETSFIIASSYSGYTEETLSAYRHAKARGLRAVAITTGGQLAEEAERNGDPVLTLPGGFPPRAALAHSLTACASLVAWLDPGLDPDREEVRIRAAAGNLAATAGGWLDWSEGNPALRIALSLEGRIPVVYGGHPVAVAAARRWKTQLNENAKMAAWWGSFPEHNHNEIMGLEASTEVVGRLVPVYLETEWDHPRITRRIELVEAASRPIVAEQHRVRAEAETLLEAMLWLCHFGDCASFLVSIIDGKDPTPVASIDQLKLDLGD